MPDAETIQAATQLKLDVATNALREMVKHIAHLDVIISQLTPEAYAEFHQLRVTEAAKNPEAMTTDAAISLAMLTLACLAGITVYVPPRVASERFPDPLRVQQLLRDTR